MQGANRPSFREIYMYTAMLLSERSTCRRLSVGTVITSIDYRQVYSVGYNGNATGLDNDCDSDEPGKCGCLHSEINAIINCTAPRESPKVVFVTHSPCVMCAKALINLGGTTYVYYGQEYRNRDGLYVLQRGGILSTELKSS
jgi:dCMP deaminase